MSAYEDPILQKIIDVVTAGVGTAIKSFYQGDPILIAKSDLPALLVSKDTTQIGDASNAEDYHRMGIVLTLVVDIRQLIEEESSNIQMGDQKLYDIFEGRNADYTLKTTSIIDILRKNHDLGNNANIDLQNPMTVDYGFTIGKRGENSWAWEGSLALNIYLTQLRG